MNILEFINFDEDVDFDSLSNNVHKDNKIIKKINEKCNEKIIKKKGKSTKLKDSIAKKINIIDKEKFYKKDLNLSSIATDCVNVNNLKKIQKKILLFENQMSVLKKYNITISTMTLNCKLLTNVDLINFGKYVETTPDGIYSIRYIEPKKKLKNGKYTCNKIIHNTLDDNELSKISKTMKDALARKDGRGIFFNQNPVLMVPQNNIKHGPIDIKIFRNGSVHATGCKSMMDFYCVGTKLIEILKNPKNENKPFVLDTEKIKLSSIKIQMINTNYHINYSINIYLLVNLLENNHKYATENYIEWKWKPAVGHCCINTKFTNNDGNKTSIFIFQSGAIIITGCQTIDHVINGKIFIDKIFNLYKSKVRIPVLDWDIIKNDVDKKIKSIKKTGKK